nr:MAG TPA: protein of unknown function (DUF3330) [Caudoviricetes sp.]
MRGEKILLTCEKCGKQFIRYKCLIKPGITHFFCSRACAKEHLSTKMTKMNEDLNPTRMDNFETRLAVEKVILGIILEKSTAILRYLELMHIEY